MFPLLRLFFFFPSPSVCPLVLRIRPLLPRERSCIHLFWPHYQCPHLFVLYRQHSASFLVAIRLLLRIVYFSETFFVSFSSVPYRRSNLVFLSFSNLQLLSELEAFFRIVTPTSMVEAVLYFVGSYRFFQGRWCYNSCCFQLCGITLLEDGFTRCIERSVVSGVRVRAFAFLTIATASVVTLFV